MRTPIIAGNWKMNTTVSQALELVGKMRGPLESISGVESAVCPPFVSLAPVAQLLTGSSIRVGAQNVFWEDKGAYTGEISPVMLAPLCTYAIVGHSERRQYFGETDETVNRRLKAALRHGLRPILCVGENLAEPDPTRAGGHSVAGAVRRRLRADLGYRHWPRGDGTDGSGRDRADPPDPRRAIRGGGRCGPDPVRWQHDRRQRRRVPGAA